MSLKKTATLHKVINENQVCFKLSEPIDVTIGFDFFDKEFNPKIQQSYFVLSSKADNFFKETFLFACDRDGKINHWPELHRSMKGDHDFGKPLETIGYEVIIPPAFKILFKKDNK